MIKAAVVGFRTAREVRDAPEPLNLWLIHDDEQVRFSRGSNGGAIAGP